MLLVCSIPAFCFCLNALTSDSMILAQELAVKDSLLSMDWSNSNEVSCRCYPSLDKSIPAIKVDSIWSGILGTSYKGRGVIIGIYDSGIDWSHQDFIDSIGNSRILWIWDQTDESGPHPDDFSYGTEYTQDEINDEIDGSPEGVVLCQDTWGHGTHVAGIAAGNGRGTGNGKLGGVYVGVAPEADLIVVKGGDTIFDTERVLNGLTYIFNKADAFDPPKPVVVNLSVGGTHFGPHDGTSVYERGIDDLLYVEGHAIVVAAGNEGDDAIHFLGDFSSGTEEDTLTIPFKVSFNQDSIEDYVSFDIWYHTFTELSVTVITPKDSSYGAVDSGQHICTWETGEGRISVDNASTGSYSINGDMRLHVRISDSRSNNRVIDNLSTGSWKLFFSGKSGRFDGWIYESSMEAWITNNADTTTLLAEPANARLCISVGSYISRSKWPSLWMDPWGPGNLNVGELSKFSSPGPTRTNAKGSNPYGKPEVAAPGEFILSSYSKSIADPPSAHYFATDSVHLAWRGTSMAAPHVTGVVALMLEMNPEFTSSEIKMRIIQSALEDIDTGPVWNPNWGYGKLDALGAMRTTYVHKKGREIVPDRIFLFRNYPNPFNESTVIEFKITGSHSQQSSVELDIFDPAGRFIKSLIKTKMIPGHFRVTWNGFDEKGTYVSSGVYICRLKYKHTILTRKILFVK